MTTGLVLIRCARCGCEWYVPGVKEYVRQVEEMWRPWEQYMTPDQKQLVAEKNNVTRLEQILKKDGYLTSICDSCRLALTLMAMYGTN
jgi:hypothetical protein